MIDKDSMLMASVAHLYYKKNLSQEHIAQQLFISRSTVSRILQRAIEDGIVEIHINFPFERDTRLESLIQNRYGLDSVHVLVTEKSSSFEQICHYASAYIEKRFVKDMIIGLSSGRTVNNICSQFEGKKDLNLMFTQVKGNASTNSSYIYDSPESIRKTAMKFDARLNLIYSPLYVFSQTVREYLLEELIIKNAMNIARKSEILLASVGNVTEDEISIYRDYLDYHNIRNLVKRGSVASIMGHFLNQDGKAIDVELEKAVIGLSLEEIRNIKNTIVVAHGSEKSLSLKSVLKAGLVNTLIIDISCAKNLL